MSQKRKNRQLVSMIAGLLLAGALLTSCAGIQSFFPDSAKNRTYPQPVAQPPAETEKNIPKIEVVDKIEERPPSRWAPCLADGEPAAYCIQSAQIFLFKLGYHPGPRDGIFGQRTRNAILTFQKDMTVPEDGTLSEDLLILLESMVPESLRRADTSMAELDPADGIRKIQQLLSQLGYQPGPVDGISGGRTRRAIRRFQKDLNLPVNGLPSQYLIGQLNDRVSPVQLPGETIAGAREKAQREQSASVRLKPRLYLLAVGASRYRNNELALAYPSKDARDFATIMAAQKSRLYSDVEVKLLTDPDRDTILSGLEWLEKETTSRDVAMAFFAGHGVTDRNNNYYFMPVEGDPDQLKRTAIPFSEIERTLTGLPGKVVAFADTCHAGGMMGKRLRGASMNMYAIAEELSNAENGMVFFASATGRQNALEDDHWQNGAFTKALVEGLSGKADINSDQAISITELDYYLSERVKQLTHGKQTPATAKPATVQDFPVAVKAGFQPTDRPASKGANINATRQNNGISEELRVTISMLKSTNSYKKRTAAMNIYRLYPHNPQALAAAKDELLSGFESQNLGYQKIDTLAWMCKILGESGKSEFIPVLKAVAAGAKSYKLRSAARKGIRNLGI